MINYLDTTIHKTPTNWMVSIYRKPTFTDTIIPYTSNHPTQHNFAAVRFLYNRLNTYDLLTEDYKKEELIIHNILENNSFPVRPQKRSSLKQRKHKEPNPIEKQKMGHIYTRRKRKDIYHKHLQTNQHQNSIPDQQQYW